MISRPDPQRMMNPLSTPPVVRPILSLAALLPRVPIACMPGADRQANLDESLQNSYLLGVHGVLVVAARELPSLQFARRRSSYLCSPGSTTAGPLLALAFHGPRQEG